MHAEKKKIIRVRGKVRKMKSYLRYAHPPDNRHCGKKMTEIVQNYQIFKIKHAFINIKSKK